ncbi:MAG: hypothetical protein ACC660_00370, partial [Acidimicrobiales bacterium]
PEPFVTQLGRQPGQKENRWVHLLDDGTAEASAEAGGSPQPTSSPARHAPAGTGPGTDHELRSEVARLRADVDRLYDLLGETPPDGR